MWTHRKTSLLLAGVNVVAAGLDIDWQEHPFGLTDLLCAMATTVTKLQARCGVGGGPATMTSCQAVGAD
jgi:thymidine kinase